MIRIVIVADIRLYREGLVDLSPDVILVDQAMPDSILAIRSLRALLPSAKIVALAVPETEHDAIGCAEAGVGVCLAGGFAR